MKHDLYVTTLAGDTYRSLPTPTDLASTIVASMDDPEGQAVMAFDTLISPKRETHDTVQVVIPFRAVASVTVDPPLWIGGRMEKVTPGAVFAVDETISRFAGHVEVTKVTANMVHWAAVTYRPGPKWQEGEKSQGGTAVTTFARGISPTTRDELTDAGALLRERYRFPMWADV